MSKTYTTGTDRARVRLLIADTQVDNGLFTDTEVDDALTLDGSVEGAAARLLRVLAAASARKGDGALSSSYLAIAAGLAAEVASSLPTVATGFAIRDYDSAFPEV